jgi:small subunit ribosomal protein S13
VARIAGVDLPRNKRIEVALTYIYGIGRPTSRQILTKLGLSMDTKTDVMPEDELVKLRDHIEKNFTVEGELRRAVGMSIKRLMDLGVYRGIRHRKSLPVRGQRTHTNARTRKGPRKTVAVRKQLKVSK